MIRLDTSQFDKQLKKIVTAKSKELLDALAPAINECANLVLDKSKGLAPPSVKGTGKVVEAKTSNKTTAIEAQVVYGGQQAISTHERLDIKHKPPAQPMYLTAAAAQAKPEVMKIIAKAIAKIKSRK